MLGLKIHGVLVVMDKMRRYHPRVNKISKDRPWSWDTSLLWTWRWINVQFADLVDLNGYLHVFFNDLGMEGLLFVPSRLAEG